MIRSLKSILPAFFHRRELRGVYRVTVFRCFLTSLSRISSTYAAGSLYTPLGDHVRKVCIVQYSFLANVVCYELKHINSNQCILAIFNNIANVHCSFEQNALCQIQDYRVNEFQRIPNANICVRNALDVLHF